MSEVSLNILELKCNIALLNVLDLYMYLHMKWRRKWQATPVFLPGKSHGEEPDDLQSMGSQRVRKD